MGNYISKQLFLDSNLEQEIIARTDRDRTGGVNDVVLAQFIADAEGEVDGYLRAGAYATPLTSPLDPSIPPLTLDVCRYRYWVGATPPEQVGERYTAATKRLTAIQSGRVQLALADAGPVEESVLDFQAPTRVFTDETLEGF
jgi:phage gp36-like protein